MADARSCSSTKSRVESAKIQAYYIHKEAELRRQHAAIEEREAIAAAQMARKKVELDAEIAVLKQEAEIAVAEAGEQVYPRSEPVFGLPPLDARLKTADFIHKHSFVPTKFDNHEPNNHISDSQHKCYNDFGKFLLKKDLRISRLTKYDDAPQNFLVWKTSFLSVMEEMEATPMEELDHLVKWLGPQSSRQALNIRAANVRNPPVALERVWERLHNRYGAPEVIEQVLKTKLNEFPVITNKDPKKLFELADLLTEIQAVKEDSTYSMVLSYFDSSTGVNPIVCKLPPNLREKWVTHAVMYKEKNKVTFPPFYVFVDFVTKWSKIKNDPSLCFDSVPSNLTYTNKNISKVYESKPSVVSRKTDSQTQSNQSCPLHNTNHSLNNCRAFRVKGLQERKQLLKEKGICFKCCETKDHVAKHCNNFIKCSICSSTRHPAALHVHEEPGLNPESKPFTPRRNVSHAGEPTAEVSSHCTQICNSGFVGKSCSRTVLANVYPRDHPEKSVRMYVILDDQSNRTLAKSDFFESLGQSNSTEINYILSSCTGTYNTCGRTVEAGLVISSVDGSWQSELPPVIECNDIPNKRDEIPTQEIAKCHPHLEGVEILEIDENADIMLLIGRDLPDAHHVLEQIVGPKNSPYAQRLPLGWAVIGEVCLDKVHAPTVVNVNKTYILNNGRPTIFEPCESEIGVFQRTKFDNMKGMSREDGAFMALMEKEFQLNKEGLWSTPLPFRQNRPRLPNNRPEALRRAKLLDMNLRRNPVKRQHLLQFMDGLFQNSYAERAPDLLQGEECWFLPIFGVYHPLKKTIRGVFDSSAKYEGLSLNTVLMSGPDLTNSLLGVLLRFRLKSVAVTADIEQMFYRFKVREDHRNYLRFMWYKDNDFQNELVEYRMTVHVFGNSPSPAVANYGLKQVAALSAETSEDVARFIERSFYVDDGLASRDTPTEAIELMKTTQECLKNHGKIRLHKIASNSREVMEAFPTEDLAKDLREVSVGQDLLPNQTCLGLMWDLNNDVFTFRHMGENMPETRRAMLSVINSIYDPLGIASPVTVEGKVLFRDIMAKHIGWDEPIPDPEKQKFQRWCQSLTGLRDITVRRTYTSTTEIATTELFIYCDASEKAIAAVAYMGTTSKDRTQEIGFIMGKSKVAPQHGHTIPRLELCAAVLAVQLYDTISSELEVTFEKTSFFTDSKIVLGYLCNEKRRFHVYVGNRVDRIRQFSEPHQWNYVPTHENPADNGTRSLKPETMEGSLWINGPPSFPQPSNQSDFQLVDPQHDTEIRTEVVNLKTEVQSPTLDTERFERFSTWKALLRAMAILQHVCQSFESKSQCKGWHICAKSTSVTALTNSQKFILRTVQKKFYSEEISNLQSQRPVSKSSPIQSLNPFLDEDNLLRVGGRLSQSQLHTDEKNPIIVPGRSHIGLLLVRHYHDEVRHQGRLITEGAIRSAGFWVISCKRIIATVIYNCVKCRKLRGKFQKQLMADLPADRLEPAPPFTYVGVDTFGPWSIISRKTRGGQANQKRWAVMFTCLVIRAIHIEVVEEMSASSFINALRRFVSIRGNVREFRSDRGTNFVGSTHDLKINAINVEDGPVNNFLTDKRAVWIFNPPHASHFGGVWERMIGIARRIIDSLITDFGSNTLTHEVLTTFMAEVCCIVNSRPIVPVSVDPDTPEVLSPNSLLTQKSDSSTEFYTNLDMKDIYRVHWKRVQALAESFWKKWRTEYLHTLQARRKWTESSPNINVGDVVLLKDQEVCRNQWPVGVIEELFPSSDGKVRKVNIRVVKDGKLTSYIRPVTEVVLLIN